MKITFLEPLGISGESLKEIVEHIVGSEHEITYYHDRNEDPAVLAERSQARGPVVDSQALADALNEGKIAGAAVDVFEMEPPVPQEHVLLHARNLIATPHVAFASQQAFEKRAVIVAENIKGWLAGNMQNVIC